MNESLFLLADVTATRVDVEAQIPLPDTKRLSCLEILYWVPQNGWCRLRGEWSVLWTVSPTFLLPSVLFSTFYEFNIEYQESASATLEPIQRNQMHSESRSEPQNRKGRSEEAIAN